MNDNKNLHRNATDYHLSVAMLRKLVKQGLLTEEEFKRADEFLYKRYEPYKRKMTNVGSYVGVKIPTITKLDAVDRGGLISLTDIARQHGEDKPGYTIQSWLRSHNTLEFLNLWEQENNPDYSISGYKSLKAKAIGTSFTVTPKQWIEQTKAIGLQSKQGKNGGTFANATIACEFLMWLSPRFKLDFIEMHGFLNG